MIGALVRDLPKKRSSHREAGDGIAAFIRTASPGGAIEPSEGAAAFSGTVQGLEILAGQALDSGHTEISS